MNTSKKYEDFINKHRDRSIHVVEGNSYCVDFISHAIVSAHPDATFGVRCTSINQAKIIQLTGLLKRSDILDSLMYFSYPFINF